MKLSIKSFIILLFTLTAVIEVKAQTNGTIEVDPEWLYLNDKRFFQDFCYQSPISQKLSLELVAYFFRSPEDSLKVFEILVEEQFVKKGIGIISLDLSRPQIQFYILSDYSKAIKETDGTIPVGSYMFHVRVHDEQGRLAYSSQKIMSVSKGYNPGPVANQAMQELVLKNVDDHIMSDSSRSRALISHSKAKLERYFRKKGFHPEVISEDGEQLVKLNSGRWDMGTVDLHSNLSSRIAPGASERIDTELESFRSLRTQFRDLKEKAMEDKEVTGQFSIAGYLSNEADELAKIDNQYYEVAGNVAFSLLNIPVQLSGFYTSQDIHREAKASYFHLSYDVGKAKAELMEMITGFNKRFEQSRNLGSSYQMVYGPYLNQLSQEKAGYLDRLQNGLGISRLDEEALSLEYFQDQVKRELEEEGDQLIAGNGFRLDSNCALNGEGNVTLYNSMQKAKRIQEIAHERYEKARSLYQKAIDVQEKLDRYQALLDQYATTLKYDSALLYSKVNDLDDLDNASYKDLAKKAANILPEGKVKSAVTGLTNLDVGIFPKYQSKYTLSGQMLRGFDVGYDIGFAEVGATYGKTQFIDRIGHVEDYKTYGARVRFKPFLDQSFGFVYFGYSPAASLIAEDNFFKDVSISMPSFRNPVSVYALTYAGRLSKYINLNGEYALSNRKVKKGESRETKNFKELSSYTINISTEIPVLNIGLEAEYEYAGENFENSTLPVMLSGTELLKLRTRGALFRGFLSFSAEYNYLLQNNYFSTGKNSKWGFQLATHSRRYPSVSISYKPFSTFRTFDDTMQVRQKPLFGEVWNGKLTYQIKRQSNAIRFFLLYNYNQSSLDTVRYDARTAQMNIIYSRKASMFAVNFGLSEYNSNQVRMEYAAFEKSKFLMVNVGGKIGPSVYLNGGTDIAYTAMGLSKYGFIASGSYSFKKLPLVCRINFRNNNYLLTDNAEWEQIYALGLELNWRFRFKL